jgi:hypothetical protein
VGDIFINKQVWKHFSEEEKQTYVDEVFSHYRTTGFPYFPTESAWRGSEYQKLVDYDFRRCLDVPNKLVKQSMHGLSLCWSYHPQHYSIPCNDKRTVMEVFNSDELFLKVIHRRVSIGDNMSDNGVRKMLKIFTGTQCVSNFRPTAAAAIYSHFCEQGDTVFDMSSGFGGRMLGAHLSGVRYIGTDPAKDAFVGNRSLNKDFNLGSRLLCRGSEVDLPLMTGAIDFCFTSPPYFDTERYCTEDTQSCVKYPSKDAWREGFLRRTVKTCHRVLKEYGRMVINIADVPNYPTLVADTTQVALDEGFLLEDIWGLQLSSLLGAGFKTEPLLIFRKA